MTPATSTQPMGTLRRLLMVKPSSLGDIVHAMPTVASLRRGFPEARVTWLVKQQWAPIVERIGGVDEVCAVSGGLSGWLNHVPALRAAAFDLVVDLQGLFRSGAMTWLTGCPRRIGFANAREGSPFFIRNGSRFPAPLCMPSTGTCWCRMPWGHRVPPCRNSNFSGGLTMKRRSRFCWTVPASPARGGSP